LPEGLGSERREKGKGEQLGGCETKRTLQMKTDDVLREEGWRKVPGTGDEESDLD